MWFSFNFDISIICFIISASFGCPLDAAGADDWFAGTGTCPIFEALLSGADEVWAKEEAASEVDAINAAIIRDVFIGHDFASDKCFVTSDKWQNCGRL